MGDKVGIFFIYIFFSLDPIFCLKNGGMSQESLEVQKLAPISISSSDFGAINIGVDGSVLSVHSFAYFKVIDGF